MAPRNANRGRVEPRINPVLTQPNASPVDTYVRPEESSGQQLARALAEVSPQVGRFNQTLSEAYVANQRARGEQAARLASEEAQKLGDMTRMGKLPMQENPYFMSAYEEEWGRVAAGMWQSDFKAAAAEDQNLKDSTNLQDFDKAIGAHVADWMQKHNVQRSEAFERGFGNMKDAYVANERLAFAAGVEKKLDGRSDEALFALTKRAITDNWGRPGITPEAIAKDIDTMVSLQVARGRPERNARRSATAAIRAAALDADDPDSGLMILDLLGKVGGEKGTGKLVDQSYGSEALAETRKELLAASHAEAERQRQAEAHAKKEHIEEVAKAGFEALQQNPNVVLSSWLKRTFPDADPETVAHLRTLQDQWKDLSYPTNQWVFRGLFNRIWDPQEGEPEITVSEIVSKSRNNQLRPQDTAYLIGQMEALKNAKKKDENEKDPLDQRAKQYLKLAEDYAEGAFKDPTSGIAAGDLAERVRNAKAMLLAGWHNLKATGTVPQMSESDLNQWFIEEMNRIVTYQVSDMSISIQKPPPAVLGVGTPQPQKQEQPSAPQQQGAKGSGSTGFPEQFVLTKSEILGIRSGSPPQSVKEKMRKFGVPDDQFKAFVEDQLRILKASRPKSAERPKE